MTVQQLEVSTNWFTSWPSSRSLRNSAAAGSYSPRSAWAWRSVTKDTVFRSGKPSNTLHAPAKGPSLA